MERPREAYLSACESLGSALAGDGFRYARSRQHATRDRGVWTHRVAFQSSHRNEAGSVVKLWISASVSNSDLDSWRGRSGSPFKSGPRVAGGLLGNLAAGRWREWNLADPSKRDDVVTDALRAVREIAFPYFELLSNPPALLVKLSVVDVPLLDLKDAAELLLCTLGPEAAQHYFSAWCNRHADLMPSIGEYVDLLARDGRIARHGEAFAAQAATLMKHYGLKAEEGV